MKTATTQQTSKSTDGLFDVHIGMGIACGGRIVPPGRTGGFPYCSKCGTIIRPPKRMTLVESQRLLAHRKTLAKKTIEE